MASGRVLTGLLRRSGIERIGIARAFSAEAGIGPLLPEATLRTLLRRRLLLGLLRRPTVLRTDLVKQAIAGSLLQLDETSLSVWRQSGGPEDQGESGRLGPRAFILGTLLAEHVRANGSGAAARPFPQFPGQLIRDCFRLGGVGEARAADWVARVMRGWALPDSKASLLAHVARVRGSGLFDAVTYRNRAGIAGDDTQAAIHYVLIGDALGLAPSDRFDPAYYDARYPDLLREGARLLHYIDHGCREGRHPTPPRVVRTGRAPDESRQNVLLVVHETSRTGAPVLGWNIARRLAATCNVFLVLLGDGPLTADFNALCVETHGPFPSDRQHSADLDAALQPLFDGRSFSCAIVNSCESRSLIQPCAKRLIPTVLLMHEFASYVHARDSLRAAFDAASEIVFPARMVAQSALEVHPPLGRRPLRILPQGMSILPGAGQSSPHTGVSSMDRLKDECGDNSFVVLGAGSVHYRKGVDIFVSAAMIACREPTSRRLKFVWVGHGYDPDDDMAYSIYLREQIDRSGLRDTVSILDAVSDMEGVYALADVFLLASRLDPLPNVSIDAACRGIPIVCFAGASGMADILQADELTRQGVVGHLDATAAANMIVHLEHDREAWSRLSNATRSLGQSNFDMATYVDAILAFAEAASSSEPGEEALAP